jgi:hypothetical protein
MAWLSWSLGAPASDQPAPGPFPAAARGGPPRAPSRLCAPPGPAPSPAVRQRRRVHGPAQGRGRAAGTCPKAAGAAGGAGCLPVSLEGRLAAGRLESSRQGLPPLTGGRDRSISPIDTGRQPLRRVQFTATLQKCSESPSADPGQSGQRRLPARPASPASPRKIRPGPANLNGSSDSDSFRVGLPIQPSDSAFRVSLPGRESRAEFSGSDCQASLSLPRGLIRIFRVSFPSPLGGISPPELPGGRGPFFPFTCCMFSSSSSFLFLFPLLHDPGSVGLFFHPPVGRVLFLFFSFFFSSSAFYFPLLHAEHPGSIHRAAWSTSDKVRTGS